MIDWMSFASMTLLHIMSPSAGIGFMQFYFHIQVRIERHGLVLEPFHELGYGHVWIDDPS